MLRAASVLCVVVTAATAGAQSAPSSASPAPVVATAPERTFLWPWTLTLRVAIGAEPHTHGTPIAYGITAEALWRGRVGPFLSLIGSSGTRIVPELDPVTRMAAPAIPDRVSVPFGLAARPFARAAEDLRGYGGRVLAGIGLQAGLSVEHYRTSDRSTTTAGLHLELGVELPILRGPLEGNALSLRAAGRMIVAAPLTYYVVADDSTSAVRHSESILNGQFLFAVCYYP